VAREVERLGADEKDVREEAFRKLLDLGRRPATKDDVRTALQKAAADNDAERRARATDLLHRLDLWARMPARLLAIQGLPELITNGNAYEAVRQANDQLRWHENAEWSFLIGEALRQEKIRGTAEKKRELLGFIGAKNVREPTIHAADLLRDPDEGVRQLACSAISSLRALEHAPRVAELLTDPDPL